MKKEKKSFILHMDSLEILDKMTNEQSGKFIKKIYEYQKTGKIKKLDFGLEMAILPFINQFKRDIEKYEKTCKKNKKIADERWSTKSTTGKNGTKKVPKSTKSTDSDSDSDSDKKEKERKEKPPLDSSHIISTPLYPPNEEKKGVLKQNKKSGGAGGVGDVIRSLAKSLKPEWTTDDVVKELNEHAVNLIKQNSPGWDLNHLASVYVSGINGKSREAPKSIRAAFPVWCGKYTKGKRP